MIDRAGPGPSPIVRYITKSAPVDAAESRYVSHFATCSKADEFRRGRR